MLLGPPCLLFLLYNMCIRSSFAATSILTGKNVIRGLLSVDLYCSVSLADHHHDENNVSKETT